jgi:hypothetical protein
MHEPEVRQRRLNRENRNEMFFRGNFLLLQKVGRIQILIVSKLP